MDVRPNTLMKVIQKRAVTVDEDDDAGGKRNTPREKIRDEGIQENACDAITDGLCDGASMQFGGF